MVDHRTVPQALLADITMGQWFFISRCSSTMLHLSSLSASALQVLSAMGTKLAPSSIHDHLALVGLKSADAYLGHRLQMSLWVRSVDVAFILDIILDGFPDLEQRFLVLTHVILQEVKDGRYNLIGSHALVPDDCPYHVLEFHSFSPARSCSRM